MVSYANQNEASPSLWAANCETVATFVGPWGAANCEAVATFVGPWEVQRSGVPRTSRLDLAAPWGADTWATVATFVGSWEVQRSGVLRA